MFDSNTRWMIDYWRGLCAGRELPARTDLDPADFAMLAHKVFVAEMRLTGEIVFRLAGGAIEELHGMPLRGVEVARFWRPAHRAAITMALEASLANASPLVVGAHAVASSGSGGGLEILYAPLTGPTGVADRIVGLYQGARGMAPIDPPVAELSLRRLDGADAWPAPPTLRLAALDGQRIA